MIQRIIHETQRNRTELCSISQQLFVRMLGYDWEYKNHKKIPKNLKEKKIVKVNLKT